MILQVMKNFIGKDSKNFIENEGRHLNYVIFIIALTGYNYFII